MRFIYGDLSRKIIKCGFRVHNELGSGYPEIIYQKALALVFEKEGILFQREVTLPVIFEKEIIGKRNVDFVVEGKIMLELKAVSELERGHFVQAINYLDILNMDAGLLVNFGARMLEVKRVFRRRRM